MTTILLGLHPPRTVSGGGGGGGGDLSNITDSYARLASPVKSVMAGRIMQPALGCIVSNGLLVLTFSSASYVTAISKAV